jgi:hypothetical protein
MAGWFRYTVGATVLCGLHQVSTKVSATAGSGDPSRDGHVCELESRP